MSVIHAFASLMVKQIPTDVLSGTFCSHLTVHKYDAGNPEVVKKCNDRKLQSGISAALSIGQHTPQNWTGMFQQLFEAEPDGPSSKSKHLKPPGK